MTPQTSEWRHLAEEASTEMDATKLLTLVQELNRILDREETSRHMPRNGVPA